MLSFILLNFPTHATAVVMPCIHLISTFLLLIKFKLNIFLHRKYQLCHFPACLLHFWQFSALVMSPRSHNKPGSDGGGGANFTPTGHWRERGGKRKQHQQVMSRFVLISRCWIWLWMNGSLPGQGRGDPGLPPWLAGHNLITRRFKTENDGKLPSLNFQHFAI